MVKQPFVSCKALAHHPIETTITPPPKKKTNMDAIKRWFRKKIGISASPFAGLTWSHPTASEWNFCGGTHGKRLDSELQKVQTHMDVSENRETPPNHPLKNRVFHYKPSILGYPYFWKHPHVISGRKPIRSIILSATCFFLSGMYCQLGDYILDTPLKNPFLELQTTTS